MKRLIGAALALSLVTASVAMAGEHRDYNDRRDWSAEHRDFDSRRHDDRHDWQHDQRNRDERDWREDRHHDDHVGWRGRPEWQDRRGHDWNERQFRREHDWRRGERLPDAYYAPSYVVGDYRAYGLREPPYGYHWVRVNGDVVLAAVATGVVLDVVYNAF